MILQSRFRLLCSRASHTFRTTGLSALPTLTLCVPGRFFTRGADRLLHPQHQQIQKPQHASSKVNHGKPTAGASSASFLADHKLDSSLRRWSKQDLRKTSQGARNASATSPRSTGKPTANRSNSAASSRSSAVTPSHHQQYPLQRKMHGKNRIAVLYPHDSHVVTLDLSIEAPMVAPNATAATSSIVKSMARDEQEPAVKTLDRMRLLFAPPRPKGQASKRQSREELLAGCPSVRVYCRASEVNAAAEEDAGELAAPGSADVKMAPGPEGDKEGEVLYRELNSGLPNRIFWKYAHVLVLNESTTVRIFFNVPTITAIATPGVPYVGLPLACASVSVLFAKEEDVCYEWCVVGEGSASNRADKTQETTAAAAAAATARVVGTASTFTPPPDLIGQHMMLRVSLDSSTGLWTELRLPDAVRPLPPPVARWQETTTPVAPPAFRVVTYNVLYDDFCTSSSSKAKIYPFATDDILDLENRKVRIAQELLAYHADLVCLQECGRDVFQSFLLPVMRAAGYDGVYMNKCGTVKEGCAFLFRQSRYELVHADSIPLNYATLAARHVDLAERVGACPELKESLSALTTIGARLVLRDVASNTEMVVGNTHLFYHANACHIRILQAYMLMHWLHTATVTRETANMESTSSPSSAVPLGGEDDKASAGAASSALPMRPVVLCGDFNCTHPTGAYRLLTTGQVEAEHHSWEKGKLFWWGCSRLLGYDAERLGELLGEETVLPQATVARKDFKREKRAPGESVSPTGQPNEAAEPDATSTPARGDDHVVTEVFREALHTPPLHLQDAYQRTDPSLPWTNFTLTFREVIDYVFFSSGSIEVLRTVPIPPESELTENFALPNKKFPSDHVALIADLSFKQ